jgi:formyltetrahydrofolate-dependent phosphoribosylglycinamide formyltransferase
MRPRLVVLVSGSGRSLRNILERERQDLLPTETALVISSRPNVGALDHADHFGVPHRVLAPDAITPALDAIRPTLVVMAGYLRHWPLPTRYIGRTINIHPALLPLFCGRAFFGHRVHEAVLASGMRVSGCTVHFVTHDYDCGPIIDQRTVRVTPNDTPDSLAARVFEQELELLPACIEAVVTGRARLDDGRTVWS